MPPGKILIADPLHPIFKEEAEKLGFTVDDRPELSKQQTVAVLAGYQVLAIRTKFRIDKEVMDAGPNLKVIARAGAGTDNIDIDYAKQRGITCIHAAEGNRDAVAEHALAMLLNLMNRLNKADCEIRNGIWNREENRGHELSGRTVAIIGYGNTGRSFAKKISGFGVKVLAYDKYKTGFSDGLVSEASMEEVVKQADVLSLHLPLTRETSQLLDSGLLHHFKKPFYLVNTSRGEIVNTGAVLDAIEAGKLLGACLDVLETEGFPAMNEQTWFARLAASDKVLLSPHVAGWTIESYRRISEVLAGKLARLVI